MLINQKLNRLIVFIYLLTTAPIYWCYRALRLFLFHLKRQQNIFELLSFARNVTRKELIGKRHLVLPLPNVWRATYSSIEDHTGCGSERCMLHALRLMSLHGAKNIHKMNWRVTATPPTGLFSFQLLLIKLDPQIYLQLDCPSVVHWDVIFGCHHK